MGYKGRYQPDYCKDRVWIRPTDLGKRLTAEFFSDWKDEPLKAYGKLHWYIESSLLDRGEKATRFLLKKLRLKAAQGKKPVALALWAIRQPIGAWMADRDYDQLKRRPTSLEWEEGEPSRLFEDP